MRNCPGAGRPTCMESFNRSSSAAQLSTKLVTGILREREQLCQWWEHHIPQVFPQFLFASQLSCQILRTNTPINSFNTRLLYQVIRKQMKSEEERYAFHSKAGMAQMSYSTIKISFLKVGGRLGQITCRIFRWGKKGDAILWNSQNKPPIFNDPTD